MGIGCQKCSATFSKPANEWLDSLNIHDMIKEHPIIEGSKLKADGYSPSTNTVYEFYGSYFHGDPREHKPEDYNHKAKTTFNELYKEVFSREKRIRDAGYNIITIWEYDWKK